ncbi:e9imm peptide [Streptomyces erythrochromogenes]|uniref:e9imm peptide n=1 Tax=Streptomyces erythrochromogenes TaxID=285574 RepID=UPI0022551D85|nr:e9imm peptide [Streptomyces erythrochromogenes]MCX5586791.1 e9imm peptide [Streptomyces erythrochromogenes]
MTRDEAVELAQRLMDGSITDETEADAALESLKVGLRCPNITNYIFWDFDPDLSAEKVVDRALAYKPFAL